MLDEAGRRFSEEVNEHGKVDAEDAKRFPASSKLVRSDLGPAESQRIKDRIQDVQLCRAARRSDSPAQDQDHQAHSGQDAEFAEDERWLLDLGLVHRQTLRISPRHDTRSSASARQVGRG